MKQVAKLRTTSFKINSHDLIGPGAGNGHHGHCKHCKLPLDTDLGYCSWDDTICIDREPKSVSDFPEEIRSYVNFNGLIFNADKQTFVKAYQKHSYNYAQLKKLISKIKT